jgi:hypothetical protein
MRAGTSRARTKVASRRIANATPNPMALIDVTPLVMKIAKTVERITAAAVIIRADF